MIEVLCQAPGNAQYTRIQLPDNSGTWEATDILNKAAYTLNAWTRWPQGVSNPNNIIDLQMVRAIWNIHVEPILEFRRSIEL